MHTDRTRIRRWFATPRRLLLALAAVTVASSGSLSWLGLELLRQDADVAAQREQERLDHQADLAVQSLERLLAATEERLTDWASRLSVGLWKMLRRVRTRAGDGYIDYPHAHVDLIARPHVW